MIELIFFVSTVVLLIIAFRHMPERIPQVEKEAESSKDQKDLSEDELVDKADVMAQQGDFKGAERIYLKQVTAHPDDSSLYNRLGMVYLHEKNFKDAREALEQALMLSPESDTIYNNLGLLAFEEDDFDEAIDYYEKSIKINNRIASRFVNLGLAYFMKKQYRKAVDAYEQAVILDPKEESYQGLLKQAEEKLEQS